MDEQASAAGSSMHRECADGSGNGNGNGNVNGNGPDNGSGAGYGDASRTHSPDQQHRSANGSVNGNGNDDHGDADGPHGQQEHAHPDPAQESGLTAQDSAIQSLLHSSEDYVLVYSAWTVLNNQMKQAEQDIRRLTELREFALADPQQFVSDFANKRIGPLPRAQKVLASPYVDLSKFQPSRQRQSARLDYPYRRPRMPLLRGTAPADTQPIPMAVTSSLESRATSPQQAAAQDAPTAADTAETGDADDDSNTKVVRSRTPWSQDEIERLRHLLEAFPPDCAPPMARWRLIANEHGTRTAMQISGYVRYVSPQSSAPDKKKKQKRDSDGSVNDAPAARPRRAVSGMQYMFQKSDIAMPDSDPEDAETAAPLPVRRRSIVGAGAMGAGGLPLLHVSDPVHHGFKCDACGTEPIVGRRWQCRECPEDIQVDLCDDCHPTGYETETHSKHHTFDAIETPEAVQGAPDDYSYLGF
ncbi:hypothetical protein BC831DRAFT_550807, partial [Entophlyctis helioformis]